jgi:hypothetical protein
VRAFLADGSVYVDPTDGEPMLLDRAGRVGIENDDESITWFIVREGAFVRVETAPPSEELVKLLELVSYGVGGSPEPTE